MIDEKEKNHWTELLNRKIVQVNRFKPKLGAVLKNNFSTFILDYPIFSGLTDDQIQSILEVKTSEVYKKCGEIFRVNEECDYLFLVQTGIVEKIFDNLDEKQNYKRVYQRGKGSVIGVGNICSPNKKNLYSLRAVSDCKLYKIRRSKFYSLKIFQSLQKILCKKIKILKKDAIKNVYCRL